VTVYRCAAIALLVAAVAGCAGMTASSRTDKFEQTARAYERFMRWGEFQNAYALAGAAPGVLPDFQRLQNIRVTSYEPLAAPQANADVSQIIQMVEIRYVHLHQMSERRLSDRQQWAYSADDNRWKLQSPFPVFP
jgi:hypothetical protein